MRLSYHPGDRVIFVVSKISVEPGPRAHDIHPAPNGDTYQYVVDKYWTVRGVDQAGTLELVTRRGKTRFVRKDDPRLRPARWWERWFYHDRFPDLSRLDLSRLEVSANHTGSDDHPLRNQVDQRESTTV